MRLKGKVTLVTGGGTGIGKAIARAMLAEGASVSIGGRRREPLEKTSREFSPLGPIQSFTADVRKQEDVRRLMDQTASAFGGINILVNNAGVSGKSPLAEGDDALWREILETNLTGAWYCAVEAVKRMLPGGRIINISSVLGKFGVAGYGAYCASKHGIIGLTRALAQELAPRKITVNAICPGWVDTTMARVGLSAWAKEADISIEEARQQAEAQIPIKRFVEEAEVASLAVYLASDEADAITGQAISVCGGVTT